MAFNKNIPAAGTSLRSSNPQILANQAAIETALDAWGYFATGGTQDGRPRQGSAIPFFQDAAPTTRLDGNAFTATDYGTIWIDSNSSPDNQFNILTNHSPVTWTPISTEIIAVLLAAGRVFASTLGVTGNFAVNTNKFTVAAATGNTVIAGLATIAGTLGVTGIATLGNTSKLATSSAPTADAQIANKKYVNDQDAAITDPAYTGGESHSFIGGLIIKRGTQAAIADQTGTITFASAFPNSLLGVWLQGNNVGTAPGVTSQHATDSFDYKQGNTQTSFDWVAVGY